MERSATLFLPVKCVFHKHRESHKPSVIYTANSERYRWQTIDDKLKRISPRFLSICAVSCEYNLTYARDTLNRPMACISMVCLPSGFVLVEGKRSVGAWCRHSFQQFTYQGADRSLARPGKKQSRKHLRDALDINNIETRAVIEFFLQGKAPKEIHGIVTETLACFHPGRAKDLSAPPHLRSSLFWDVTQHRR